MIKDQTATGSTFAVENEIASSVRFTPFDIGKGMSALTAHFSFPKEMTPDEAIQVVQHMKSAIENDLNGVAGCPMHEHWAEVFERATPATGGTFAESQREQLVLLIERMCPSTPESNFSHPVGKECEALADAILALPFIAGGTDHFAEAGKPIPGGTFADGVEERDPHSVEWSDLVAAIKNDGMLFEQFATRMFECWRGTGTLMEEGSASNDYRVWGNEAHNRFLHLKALLRDVRALQPGAGREDGA